MTWFVLVLITDTLSPPELATYSSAPDSATPAGCVPTGMLFTTLPREGSYTETVPEVAKSSCGSATIGVPDE